MLAAPGAGHRGGNKEGTRPQAEGGHPGRQCAGNGFRKLEILRKQTAEEIDAQRARLAAQEQELRQQSAEADKQEAEAAVVSARKAFHLKKVRAQQEEVEHHWETLQEGIAKDEADGRAKDAEARRRAYASADE